jgi:hypothetical protein
MMLALFIAARLALPFFPSEGWSESGFHCASYYVFLPLGKPHGCVAEKAFGEGARLANRLDFVSYRREKFTVDERGYRNPPLAELKPRVILMGSSFSLGLSLNDDETFAAQLNRRMGPVVYNASKVLNPNLSAAPLIATAREIGLQHGVVLLELLNRAVYGYNAAGEPVGRLAKLQDKAAGFQSLQRRMKDPFALGRITAMVNMRIANDVVLPNPERWRYPEEELKDGRHQLFYVDDKAFFHQPAPVSETIASVKQLRTDLEKAGLRLAVVLVPSGYTVYWPLLRDASGEDRGLQYMADLAAGLESIGVPALNCTPLLRDAAKREQVYWPDDAHWTPAGVRVVADATAAFISQQRLANAF